MTTCSSLLGCGESFLLDSIGEGIPVLSRPKGISFQGQLSVVPEFSVPVADPVGVPWVLWNPSFSGNVNFVRLRNDTVEK